MAENRILLAGALGGHLPSVSPTNSKYVARPLGRDVAAEPHAPGLSPEATSRSVASSGFASDTPTDPQLLSHALPPGYDTDAFVMDQSDAVCVPLGYRAGSNIRTPRG